MRGGRNIMIQIMEKLISGARQLALSLSTEQVKCFQSYYNELIDWNQRMNLTSIVDYDEVQVKHFLDSLTLALAFSKLPERVLDVGTGAGLPGMALKILYPGIELTLIDSVRKKASFLDHLIDTLGLDGVAVVAGRAEELAHEDRYRQHFDVVVSRGVARLATLLELTLPFCAVGGVVVAMKKKDVDDELNEAEAAIGVLGGRLKSVMHLRLKELDDRALVIIDKVTDTPERYPRRSGIPQKRPLLRNSKEFS